MLLVVEDTDPRRTIRFVCRLPTGSGVVVMDRKAAAAAAEDREPVDGLFLRKAWLAAAAALEVVFRSRGVWELARLALLPRRRENMLGITMAVDACQACHQDRSGQDRTENKRDGGWCRSRQEAVGLARMHTRA